MEKLTCAAAARIKNHELINHAMATMPNSSDLVNQLDYNLATVRSITSNFQMILFKYLTAYKFILMLNFPS